MTDIDRKEIINKIQQEIIEKESLSKKYEELKKIKEVKIKFNFFFKNFI